MDAMNSSSRGLDLIRAHAISMATTDRALRAALGVLALVFGAVFVGTFTTVESRGVVLILLVLTAITVVFEISLVRYGIAPFFEIGGFFAAVVWLYASYPIITYLANGLAYTPWSDLRLFNAEPTPQQIATLGWWYAAFLASFCLMYRLVRPRTGAVLLRAYPADVGYLVATVLGYAAIKIFVFAVQQRYALTAGSYLDTYVAIRNLPRLLRQIFTQSFGMLLTFTVLILSCLFTRYRKSRLYIALWIGTIAYSVFTSHAARTSLFLALFVALVLYHHLVRPISMRLATAMAIIGVLSFNLMGFLRLGFEKENASLFASTNEFESVFANAYDLMYVQHAQGALLSRPELRLSDVLSIIPQQVLPFGKGTSAEWYLSTYYTEYFATGGGLAFGVVSEGVTGWGWAELLLRGAFLGTLFGLLQRYVSRRVLSPWMLAFYVWLTMWSYQCVRNTTMPLVGWFVYQFVVPVSVVGLLAHGISRAAVRTSPAVARA
jgi:hypothetical protein